MTHCTLRSAAAVMLLTASLGLCQSNSTDEAPDGESKHLFWVMPNYRTSPSLTDYKPMTVREKKILNSSRQRQEFQVAS